jgi:hypothetical protein
MKTAVLILVALLVAGCDTAYGIRRSGPASQVPEMGVLVDRIRGFAGVKVAVFEHSVDSSRPITWQGLQRGDEIYRIRYEGDSGVRCTLTFTKDYRGNIEYSQSLLMLNRRPPQQWIDATWPVMMRVESVLTLDFALPELSTRAKTWRKGVEDPERPNKSLQPTATAVMPPAAQEITPAVAVAEH